MTLLRRRSRQVYRVYSEDEYLDGAGLELTAASTVVQEPVDLEPGDAPTEEDIYGGGVPIEEDIYGGFVPAGRISVRLRRIAGVAMLAGAVGTVGGVIAVNISRTHRGVGRGPGSLVARSSRVSFSPQLAGSRAAPSALAVTPTVTPRAKAPSSSVARAVSVAHPGRRHRGSDSHFRAGQRDGSGFHTPNARRGSVPAQPVLGVGVKRGGGVAIVLDYSPSASVDESTPARSSVEMSRPPTARPAVEQVEFGFEH